MSLNYQEFHRCSIEDRDAFWTEQSSLIDWHKPFDQVLDYSKPPFARWFTGGETNLCYNAVDRHQKDRVACGADDRFSSSARRSGDSQTRENDGLPHCEKHGRPAAP